MSKNKTLCENHDFRRLYARGRSFVTPLLVLYVGKNRLKQNRVGITTSKKIGCAVKRNRARRLIAEALRLICADGGVKEGFDLVLVARGKTPHSSLAPVKGALTQSLQKAGLLS